MRTLPGALAVITALGVVAWGCGNRETATAKPAAAASAGGYASTAPAGGDARATAAHPDINTATAAELKAVAGHCFTLETAEAVLAARDAAGGAFTSWDQVDAVPGIGAATLAKLQEAFPLAGAAGGGSASVSHRTPAGGGAKTNLNTATAEQLDALPRVSPRVAQAIIEARTAQPGRKFTAWDQVDAVIGVGEVVLANLQGTCAIQ